MAGGTPEHARICANVIALLNVALQARPCSVYTTDLRIRVRATGLATYPDISVICGHPELDAADPKRHTALNPKSLVEVLSPSTEDYDRGEKLTNYQQIDSLEEVLLVHHDERKVVVWRRTGPSWQATDMSTESSHLPSAASSQSLQCIAIRWRDPTHHGHTGPGRFSGPG